MTEGYWSEVNNDGSGTDNALGDRRFVIHTGPFTLERNDPQDIVFGIVFAQGADSSARSAHSALRTGSHRRPTTMALSSHRRRLRPQRV